MREGPLISEAVHTLLRVLYSKLRDDLDSRVRGERERGEGEERSPRLRSSCVRFACGDFLILSAYAGRPSLWLRSPPRVCLVLVYFVWEACACGLLARARPYERRPADF